MDIVLKNVGKIRTIADTIIIAEGLDRVFIGEVVSFKHERSSTLGLVLNIEEDIVKIALIAGSEKSICAGDLIYRTYKFAETKAGFGLIGRIVSPLGVCLNKADLDEDKLVLDELFNVRYTPMEQNAPGIIDREPVRTPVQTGLNAIDSLLPIGGGQRELIIGDLGAGKTSLGLTIVLNQRSRNNNFWREVEKVLITHRHSLFVPCIYVIVGGKRSEASRISRLLTKTGAFEYTTVVFTSADDLAAIQYLAPFAGAAIGEWFRDTGYKAVVIYDELLNHAAAYRQVSLLLRRPPGREAFPGDIFYLHARLLERAAQLNRKRGGGALTAFPLVETKAGDISAYIPTNIISITDGQIFLSSKLNNQGIKPAVDLNLSVSRVGSDAQALTMKQVAKKIKLDYGMYRSYAGIEKISGDVDPTILSYVNRGKKIIEYFKQELYQVSTLYQQVVCLFAIGEGFLDEISSELVHYYLHLLFDISIARRYLPANIFYLVAFPELMEAVCYSADFDIIQGDLRIWIEKYTEVFHRYYRSKGEISKLYS